MINFRIFTPKELQREKQKDYQNVVIIQCVIIVIGLTISEVVLKDPHSPEGKFVTTIFSFFGALYSYLLWDLLRDFTSNKILLKTLLGILFLTVFVGILGEFPYYQIIEVPDRRIFLLSVHMLLFVIEVTVIGFAIRDIFSGEFLTPDKLWGSACIFLMIGICFGSLYDMINLARPGSMGVDIPFGLGNYAECVTYSLSILGGAETQYPNASKLIKNIGVLEAVWGNLFVVLIIGKLMGLPRPPKTNESSPSSPS